MARTNDEKYDFVFKILAVGDAGVGKTSIMERFNVGTFTKRRMATIGVDFHMKTVDIEGKRVKMVFWDTAGTERFNSITSSCYHGKHGVLVVYDITKRSSFLNLWKWIDAVRRSADTNVCFAVLGNKSDLEEEREVELRESEDLSEYIPEILFAAETSAKENTNLDYSILRLATELKRRHDTNTLQTGLENSICLYETEDSHSCSSSCNLL